MSEPPQGRKMPAVVCRQRRWNLPARSPPSRWPRSQHGKSSRDYASLFLALKSAGWTLAKVYIYWLTESFRFTQPHIDPLQTCSRLFQTRPCHGIKQKPIGPNRTAPFRKWTMCARVRVGNRSRFDITEDDNHKASSQHKRNIIVMWLAQSKTLSNICTDRCCVGLLG